MEEFFTLDTASTGEFFPERIFFFKYRDSYFLACMLHKQFSNPTV